MSEDNPIIQEVRRAREEMFAEVGYDLEALFERARLRTEEARRQGRVVIPCAPVPVMPKGPKSADDEEEAA